MPSGFHASDPSASLRSGTPKSMNARTPASAISTASLRSDSSVCWNCPGIDAIGDRLVDALLAEQRHDQVAGVQPGLADQRAERRRAPQPPRPLLGEAHGASVPAPAAGARPAVGRQHALERASTTPSIVWGFAHGVHGEPVVPRLLRRDRSDAHDLRVALHRAERADEPPHGRGAGERHGVDLAGAERLAGLPRKGARHARAVGVDARGRPALRGERVLEPGAARCRRARTAPGPAPREGARQTGRRERRRHEVGRRAAHRGTPPPCPRRSPRPCAPSARGRSREASISTVARLVSVIHVNPPASRSRSAAVSAAERAGTISIAGATIGRAPRWSR